MLPMATSPPIAATIQEPIILPMRAPVRSQKARLPTNITRESSTMASTAPWSLTCLSRSSRGHPARYPDGAGPVHSRAPCVTPPKTPCSPASPKRPSEPTAPRQPTPWEERSQKVNCVSSPPHCLVQNVRLSVREAFVSVVNWGNTYSKRQAFATVRQPFVS